MSSKRARRGTRQGQRVLGCYRHAVLVLRWFLDGTRVAQLAVDNAISASTAYRYLHEAIEVLAPIGWTALLLPCVLLRLPAHAFPGQLDGERGGLEGGLAEYLLHHPQPSAVLDGGGAEGGP